MCKRYLTAVLFLFIAAACNKTPESELTDPATVATGPAAANIDAIESLTAPDEQNESDFATDDIMPKVCVDKLTDSKPIIFDEDENDVSAKGVFVKGTKWANGKTLKIFFINGSNFLRGKVLYYARRWAAPANLHFSVTDNRRESDIRVGFKIGGDHGSWSYIGTDARDYYKGKQTMNFGWFNKNTEDREFNRTVTHEFGHAIGLGHEQLSPVEKINWDKPKVYGYYMGPPNNWIRAQVTHNIFDKYKKREVRNSKFDPVSIMQYPVPAEFTTDNRAIGYNYHLSEKDKAFIRKIYPN